MSKRKEEAEMKNNSCRSINRVFFLIMLIMLIVPQIIGGLLPELDIYDGTVFTIYLYLIPVLLYAAVSRGRCLEDIPFRPMRFSTVLLVILFTMLLLPVMTWLNMVSMLFSENYVAQDMQTMGEESFWKNLFFVAFLPAVVEEYTVRGVFFHGYRPAGILKAALVSGLLFGVMHLNLNQFCYAAVLGFVFAMLVEATGSIFSSMFAHFLINLNSVVLLELQRWLTESGVMEYAEEVSEQQAYVSAGCEMIITGVSYSIKALGSGVLAVFVLLWIAKRCGRKDHMKTVWRRTSSGAHIVTPSLILTLVLGFAYMVIYEFGIG